MIQRLVSVLAAVALTIVPLSSRSLGAQQGSRTPTRVPVTVALVERTENYGGDPVVLLRRTDLSPRDVILLREDTATGKQLSEAVLDLLNIRGQMGDTASMTAAVRVRPHTGAPGRARRELPWAQRVVNDVRKAELQTIPGVGTVRAVQIWLPPQRKRPNN
jgi:hypothetical protein